MRLIDADALSKEVSSTTLFIKDAEVFQRMINDAPTIATPYQPYTEIKPITEGGDLISRADAIERIKSRKEWCVKFGHSDFWKRLDYTEHFIKALPSAETTGALDSADRPTVVRCKDCRFKRLCDDEDTKFYYCALEDRPNRNWSVDDVDFCSWAERREP